MIVARLYQILCPVETADTLRAALQVLDPLQEGYYQLTTALGPEAMPGEGYASTITHMLDGPATAESLYQAAVAIVGAHPGAEITDQKVQILDGDGLRWCKPDDAIDYQVGRGLYQYLPD